MTFENKVAIVTGASGNLGSAVAKKLLAAGAKLVLVDRELDLLRKVFPDQVGSSDVSFAAPADVLDESSMKSLTAETLENFGSNDILVNTVGGYRAGSPLYETPLETWDFMLNLNARSVFITCKAVIPAMLEQGSGKIINIASRSALRGDANSAAYGAAKGAVIRLTESMSAELKSSGINVNCVIPGTLDTPQNRQGMPDANFSNWVSPESLADVIVFLASNAARDVHGAAVPIYGGT